MDDKEPFRKIAEKQNKKQSRSGSLLFLFGDRLSLEHEEFVSDEVPDKRRAGSEKLSDVCPELRREIENRRENGREHRDDARVQSGTDERNGDELCEFLILLILCYILKSPVLVHEVTVHDRNRKRDEIYQCDTESARDPGKMHEYIENGKIDPGVYSADDDEFRKLTDDTFESHSERRRGSGVHCGFFQLS